VQTAPTLDPSSSSLSEGGWSRTAKLAGTLAITVSLGPRGGGGGSDPEEV